MVVQNGKDLIFAFHPRRGAPEKGQATVAVLGHDGLSFVLESMVNSSSLFGNDEFVVVVYREEEEIGRGVYKRYWHDPLGACAKGIVPVEIQVIAENGEMVGIMEVMWNAMLQRTGMFAAYLLEVAAR